MLPGPRGRHRFAGRRSMQTAKASFKILPAFDKYHGAARAKPLNNAKWYGWRPGFWQAGGRKSICEMILPMLC